ncbi:Cell division protein FtsH [Thioalkalivibrio nitratireducens DSM 14787]|uniref:ATP-dependent zinc metalloprotease FtsH n=2 Tax=Thioalkalivibrio nitratireducens TaxID=186931 RepID=L0DUS7_THIND|nr:Cell division protein FtsH [Thioalkalivibrio nitratireducens DSM 14787]
MNQGRERDSREESKGGRGRGWIGGAGDGKGTRNGVWEKWLIFVWLSLAILLVLHWIDEREQPHHTVLTYSEFLRAIEEGHVREVTLRGQDVRGRLTEAGREALEVDEPGSFETVRPELAGEALLQELQEFDIDIAAEPVEPPWWQQMLVRALPFLLLLALLVWFWGRVQQRAMAGGGGPFGFGKSTAKRVHSEDSDTRMDDVAGSENAKKEIIEVVEFLKNPSHFKELGAQIPRGILMMGPPGTGKTLLARAVAGEAGVPFFNITGSEFIEMFVGMGASRVRDLFRRAKEEAPSVVFIDELDAIGRSRGAGMGGGHDEREQTLNQILSEMDGFEGDESVVVLAATNRPDVLDKALLRPGRFDRKITLENPHREARRDILKVHTKSIPLADDVDLDRLAAGTIGFSGAELRNLANEAALFAGRRGLKQVDWACFSDARDRILVGETREHGLSDRDRQIVAYHESGHALLAYLLPKADALEKVTVIPRGRALGVTAQVPEEERYNFSESYLRAKIAVMFGGRLAESIVFNEVSNGAENDLREATRLARRMVAHWGMSERIGPVSFPQHQQEVFLGRELGHEREHSESTAAAIDEEIRKLLGDIEASARETLEKHRGALETLAEALKEQETLEVEGIREILKGKVQEGQA